MMLIDVCVSLSFKLKKLCGIRFMCIITLFLLCGGDKCVQNCLVWKPKCKRPLLSTTRGGSRKTKIV